MNYALDLWSLDKNFELKDCKGLRTHRTMNYEL